LDCTSHLARLLLVEDQRLLQPAHRSLAPVCLLRRARLCRKLSLRPGGQAAALAQQTRVTQPAALPQTLGRALGSGRRDGKQPRILSACVCNQMVGTWRLLLLLPLLV